MCVEIGLGFQDVLKRFRERTELDVGKVQEDILNHSVLQIDERLRAHASSRQQEPLPLAKFEPTMVTLVPPFAGPDEGDVNADTSIDYLVVVTSGSVVLRLWVDLSDLDHAVKVIVSFHAHYQQWLLPVWIL